MHERLDVVLLHHRDVGNAVQLAPLQKAKNVTHCLTTRRTFTFVGVGDARDDELNEQLDKRWITVFSHTHRNSMLDARTTDTVTEQVVLLSVSWSSFCHDHDYAYEQMFAQSSLANFFRGNS